MSSSHTPVSLYNPFEKFEFQNEACFLSGEKKNGDFREISVFPKWLQNRYQLADQSLGMLGGNRVKYGDLKLCCSPGAFAACNRLEKEIETAFCAGYTATVSLPPFRIFQWIVKLMYGILYHDLAYAIERHQLRNKAFKLSPLMTHKLQHLHLSLQSLLLPMEFDGFRPWSMKIVKVNYSKDIFNYKDETHNLNFSLGMNGFGIVACLQDMGENDVYHHDVTGKIGDMTLHPIQFEELSARYIYSNYLLNKTADWEVDTSVPPGLTLRQRPFRPDPPKPLFRRWDDDMYAQVLSNYWKPWGLTLKDIVSFPNPPISYLINETTYELIDPATIKHPH